jgi:membrane fusion protein (multidrug efflux system)
VKKYIAFGALGLLAVIVIYRIAGHGASDQVRSIESYQQELGVPVEVLELQRQDLVVTRDFSGTVEGVRQADAVAGTSQELIALHVSPGAEVAAGQVLAELDPDMAGNATLKFEQSRMALEDAYEDLERMQSLYDAGAISVQALEKATLRHAISQRDFEAARKLVYVTAPISGTVTHAFYKVGERVSSGKPIVRIADLDRVLVRIEVSETAIARIERGQDAAVTVPAYSGALFPGTLDYLALSADPVSRAFEARIIVDNPDHRLRPGMFAKVSLSVAAVRGALVVPRDALVESSGTWAVYVVGSDRVAALRPVVIGASAGTRVEVTEGLEPGDRVVVRGQSRLEPGVTVRLVDTTAS